MKNKITCVVTLMISLLTTGCSDQFLKDKENYGAFDERIFKSQIQTNWYLNALYYNFFNGYNSPIKTWVGGYSDEDAKMTEEIGGTINDRINPGKLLEDASVCPKYFGEKLTPTPTNAPYTRIRNCSFIILNIDNLGADLDKTFRENAKGQAYFLRALQYFDLIRMYGGVPVITEILQGSIDDESIRYPRGTTSACVEQIVKDLNEAFDNLPAKWNVTKDYGRPTKGAALALKSRVLLTHASPLFNKDWDNSSNERWNSALEAGLAAEKELEASGYGLYGSSAKDWAEMFLIDNTFCKEAVMIQLCSSATQEAVNNGWENSMRLSSQGGGGGIKVPKEMIDLFPMADGKRPVVINGYNERLFFLNRDPRFYRTFVFSGCKWDYNKADDTAATIWAYRWVKSDGKTAVFSDNNSANSPVFVRKMSSPKADRTAYSYSGTDIFEYRFAELLLNIAECYAAKGDLANCSIYLGKIRNRVGIPEANNYGIGTFSDKYAAIEACLYERRVELAYEGKRFWDIQRWMLYNDAADSGNNTCEKLRISPINGTSRIGNYLQAKVQSDEDPLANIRIDFPGINPDNSAFISQLNELADFYSANFDIIKLDVPMDKSGSDPILIEWKQHYYVWGFNRGLIENNYWLEQTKGWKDVSGDIGIFDFQN